MAILLFELSLTCYFAAAIVSIIELFRGSKATSRLIFIFAAVGFAFHTANIIARYVLAGHLPIVSIHEAASFYTWCIVLIFFFLEYRYRLDLLGPFTMPVVFVLMLSSSVFPREIKELSPVLQSYWLGIHTFLAFLGDAAFAMAFGISIMYLIQEHHLKTKRLGGLFQRLPSLQILDEVNYKLIVLGFPLLSLAIITGAVWAESAWGSYWRWDPKEVWSLITWFIYVLVLHARLTAGWRGRKAAMLSIVGFVSVIFTFFGVNLLLKGLHAFV
jgi:cytochrome c-type biogenesis protein CcsB